MNIVLPPPTWMEVALTAAPTLILFCLVWIAMGLIGLAIVLWGLSKLFEKLNQK